MLSRHIFAFLLLFISGSTLADALDVNLSNDVAQFRYIASMGNVGQGKSEMHMGVTFNDSNSAMGEVGLLVMNAGNAASIASFGVGLTALAARVEMRNIAGIDENRNVAALAIGGQIRLAPAADQKFGVVGQAYLAPDIVTSGDAKRFVQTGVRIEYEVIPQAVAYIGYRKLKFTMDTSAQGVVMDEGAHLGVRVAF